MAEIYSEISIVTALQIAKKSLHLMTSNWMDMFRICAALYLFKYVVTALATYATTGVWTLTPPDLISDTSSSVDFMIIIASLAVSIVAGLWVAVAWHRYVLLAENPQGWIPRWNKSACIAYFVQGLKLVLLFSFLLILLLMLLYVAGSLISVPINPFVGYLFALVFGALSISVFLRVSLVFPAAAIGRHLTLKDSWIATGPYRSPIFLLSGIIGFFTLNLQKISEALGANMFMSSIDFLLNILIALWTLSIMTTLYGGIIEDRNMES